MRDASIECPSLRDRRISPHTIRRATALHLLQSGVDIYVIALWLGHGSIETTHIYLEADLKTKERALLAFLMALHWYPTRRRELELPLIRYYYEGLLAQGLENYSFDELWLDYRRCVVRNLTIPIFFWKRGMKPEGWWHRLECALAAYRDLACDELL